MIALLRLTSAACALSALCTTLALASPSTPSAFDFDAPTAANVSEAPIPAGSNTGLQALDAMGDGPPIELTAVPFVAPFRSYRAEKGTGGVAVGDLNGDGVADVAAANIGSGTLSVFLANGRRSLLPATVLAAACSGYRWCPNDAIIDDVNRDGFADIVTCGGVISYEGQPDSGYVSVYAGNGDGTFADRRDYRTVLPGRRLALHDVTGDDIPDAVTAGYRTMTVLPGRGDGTFGTPRGYPTPAGAINLAVGDVDGDALPDIVVCSYHTDSLVAYFGEPDGTLSERVTLETGFSSGAIAIGDLNADGRPDLIVSAYDVIEGRQLRIYHGGAEGRTVGSHLSVRTNFLTGGLELVDVNADGALDIAAACYGCHWLACPGSVSVFMGDGAGSFLPKVDRPAGTDPLDIAVGDVTGDGVPDLVTSNDNGSYYDWPDYVGAVCVHEARRVGEFGPNLSGYPTGNTPLLSDMNGDGRLDLASFSAFWDEKLHFGLGDGAGAFSPDHPVGIDYGVGAIAAADLDGDGRTEVISVGADLGVWQPFGDSLSQVVAVPLDSLFPRVLLLNDVDGDGHLDALIASPQLYDFEAGSRFTVVPGRAGLGFGDQRDILLTQSPKDIAAADVDGDGDTDVLTAYRNGILELLNDGHGAFTEARNIPLSRSYTSRILVDDLDGDHDVDAATISLGGVLILQGDGTGQFVLWDSLITACADFLARDVTGDSLPDILTLESDGGTITLWVGRGGGTFDESLALGAGGGPWEMIEGDVNEDGRVDLVVTGSQGLQVLTGSTDVLRPVDPIEVAPPHTWLAPSIGPVGEGPVLIRFALAASARVALRVLDVQGRVLATVLDEDVPAGVHEIPWVAQDAAGRPLASGLHVLDFETGGTHLFRRMLVVR